jgi:formylglycine-generating enzyme required for sulfatase activity
MPFHKQLRPGHVVALVFTSALFLGSSALRADNPAPGAKAAEGKAYTENIPGSEVNFEMLPIPGGKFKMGSPATEKKRKDDEGPQFEVQIDPFFMGAREVTWEEYELFLRNYHTLSAIRRPQIPSDKLADAVTYPTPMYELEAGPVLERMGRGGKFPAVIMSQHAAKQYTKWLSKKTGRFYRLPSEAEWEYACRAGTATAYSFGDDVAQLKEYAWYFDNSSLKDGDGAYRKVGLKKANPWGLYDMHGNVAEWVIDQYDANWYKHFDGKPVNWKDTVNWPKTQYPRIIRGGSWNSEAEECRSASRYAATKALNVKDPQLPQSPHWMTEGFWIGFRVLAPVNPPSEAEKAKWWEVDDDYTRRVLERDREIREVIESPANKPSGAGAATPAK